MKAPNAYSPERDHSHTPTRKQQILNGITRNHSHLGIKRNSVMDVGNKTTMAMPKYANESFKTMKPTGFDNVTKIDRLTLQNAMVYNKYPVYPKKIHDRPE